METERQMRDTVGGLLRRTGPAEAELFDPMTGKAYRINFTYFASDFVFSEMDGREYCDRIFGEREAE